MPSDDSFNVYVKNLTGGTMNPSSSKLEYGDFTDSGSPVSVSPWSSGSVPQAFAVEGAFLDGPQGTVIYNINNQVNMIVQFNSNLGGNSSNNGGDYFYAGLQPAAEDADTSEFYLQVQNFSMPTGEGVTAFSPTIVVSPSVPPYSITPLSQPSASDLTIYEIWMTNDTGSLVTLNQVSSPLNQEFAFGHDYNPVYQPPVATTIAPGETQLMATLVTENTTFVQASEWPALVLVWNLAGGAVVTMQYNWNGDPISASFSGANLSRYTFSSTTPAVDGFLVQVTATLALAG